MITLEEEIKQAIKFFGTMDIPTLQMKLSMRRDYFGRDKQVTQSQIRQALRNLRHHHVVRKATGVRDGWMLVNP
jgi:hypothetical protein